MPIGTSLIGAIIIMIGAITLDHPRVKNALAGWSGVETSLVNWHRSK